MIRRSGGGTRAPTLSLTKNERDEKFTLSLPAGGSKGISPSPQLMVNVDTLSMKKWFQTWNRQEYVECALPQNFGYLLIIARKQPSNWLLAKAKLIFKKSGLPDVELLATEEVSNKKIALDKLNEWKNVS